MKRVFLFLSLIWFSTSPSTAQVVFECRIDSNQMLIGDQRIVSLQVRGLSTQPDTVSFSAWNALGVEPLGRQRWIPSNSAFHQNVLISAFDTGYIILPPLQVIYQVNGSWDTIPSNDLAIEVQPVLVDSTGLAPIKTIIREPMKLSDFLPWIAAFLLGVATILVLFLRKKKALPTVTEIEISLPPDEIALQQLSALRQKKLWQAGKIKEYQSELTHIIRQFLENRFSIPALESTTSEILQSGVIRELSPEHIRDLDQILNMADLIKFAKANPEISIHEQFMEMAEKFVKTNSDKTDS